MADNTQGGTHAQHVQAGSQSPGNQNAAQNLSDEDRSKGGKASSSQQDMTHLGQTGGNASQNGDGHQLTDEDRSEGGSH
ncbi:MAG TPA: hypothetical protein VLF93_04475 [Candidatus Saccharimonadales bacterium]|nr:hypothetical protein [Candidatus Saccharimonadales bacterium]